MSTVMLNTMGFPVLMHVNTISKTSLADLEISGWKMANWSSTIEGTKDFWPEMAYMPEQGCRGAVKIMVAKYQAKLGLLHATFRGLT